MAAQSRRSNGGAAELLAYDPAEELLGEIEDAPSGKIEDEDARLTPEVLESWIKAEIEVAKVTTNEEREEEDPAPASLIRPVRSVVVPASPPAKARAPRGLYALFAVLLFAGVALIALSVVR